MQVHEWALDTTGLDGWWAAVQFDRAVSWFGRYIESKLSEYEDGEPVYSLDELLDATPEHDGRAFIQLFAGALGVVNT